MIFPDFEIPAENRRYIGQRAADGLSRGTNQATQIRRPGGLRTGPALNTGAPVPVLSIEFKSNPQMR